LALQDVSLEYKPAAALTPELKAFAFNLTKTNMQKLYVVPPIFCFTDNFALQASAWYFYLLISCALLYACTVQI